MNGSSKTFSEAHNINLHASLFSLGCLTTLSASRINCGGSCTIPRALRQKKYGHKSRATRKRNDCAGESSSNLPDRPRLHSVGKNLEGSGSGPTEVSSLNLPAGTQECHNESQDSRCLVRDSNQSTMEYKSRGLLLLLLLLLVGRY
jgi:hypothetical protein